MIRLATLFVCLLATSPAWADTHNAATCSSSDVQTAIDAASDGDTVAIPAGDCTWTDQVLIDDKGIILQGAGTTTTTIHLNRSAGKSLRVIFNTLDPMTEITALTFDADQTDTGSNASIELVGPCAANQFRIHNMELLDTVERGIHIVLDDSNGVCSGLIDNNTFTMTATSGGSKSLSLWGSNGEWDSFDTAIDLGGSGFIFVEDNTFTFSGINDGALDAYRGARYVFRFNTVNNTVLSHHGADSGNSRSTHSFEIYNNTFETDINGPRWHNLRGGTGTIFDNTYTEDLGEMTLGINLTNYRSDESHPPWGICDGTSDWDGNEEGGGYPCLDQIGTTFTSSSGGVNTKVPLYVWGNLENAAQIDAGVSTHNAGIHIVEDRDYFNENDTFDGTSGIGIGVVASRPSTCTTGVGYWATDEGEWNSDQAGNDGNLYTCTATDTWTLTYTPYTYPHPLQGGVAGPTISTTTLPDGQVNTSYSETLAASGGTTPYTWTNNGAGTTLNDSDSHCAGLTISTAGVVSGTPTTAGVCDWTALVTDNDSNTDTQALAITVDPLGGGNDGGGPLRRLMASLSDTLVWDVPSGIVEWFEQNLNGAGFTNIGASAVAPVFPFGLGLHTFQVRACNTGGCGVASDLVEIDVQPFPPGPVDATTIRTQ